MTLLKNLCRCLIRRASFWVLMFRTPSPPSAFSLQTASQAALGFCFALHQPPSIGTASYICLSYQSHSSAVGRYSCRKLACLSHCTSPKKTTDLIKHEDQVVHIAGLLLAWDLRRRFRPIQIRSGYCEASSTAQGITQTFRSLFHLRADPGNGSSNQLKSEMLPQVNWAVDFCPEGSLSYLWLQVNRRSSWVASACWSWGLLALVLRSDDVSAAQHNLCLCGNKPMKNGLAFWSGNRSSGLYIVR